MSNLQEIKRRINSAKSTMQITRTMEMVSTAKIRKALERAEQAAPYKDVLARMLAHVAKSGPAAEMPLLRKHSVEKNVLFIVIASDRGLAGGFNVQVQRAVMNEIHRLKVRGISSQVITCGRKPTEFFRFREVEPVLSFAGTSSEPTTDQVDQIASYITEGYSAGSIDRVYVYYQHAKNRVDQTMVSEQLLPVDTEDLALPNATRTEETATPIVAHDYTDFAFDPSPESVLGYLIPAYVHTVVFHALLDSAAAEHGARRRAMRAATDNAQEVITRLSRTYNRERQGAITTELSEIIGGASALEDK